MNPRQHVATSAYYYRQTHPHSYHDPAFVSLAYRPLHYPLQLGGLPTPDHQQQEAQLSSLAAAGFQQQPTNFRLRQHHQVPLVTRQPPRSVRAHMAFEQQPPAQGMSEEELADLQKASNEYQPETTVCMCGRCGVCGADRTANCERSSATDRDDGDDGG